MGPGSDSPQPVPQLFFYDETLICVVEADYFDRMSALVGPGYVRVDPSGI